MFKAYQRDRSQIERGWKNLTANANAKCSDVTCEYAEGVCVLDIHRDPGEVGMNEKKQNRNTLRLEC